MISRINKLLASIALVSVAVFLVVKNKTPVHLYLTENQQYDLSVGIVLLAAFIAGILVASFFALMLSFKGYIRERALISKDHSRTINHKRAVDARGITAGGQWDSARVVWEQISKREPKNPIPRIEIAKSLLAVGDTKSALEVIDSARAQFPDNQELLFLSAELQEKLGNKTAAIDNYSLILTTHKSKLAAKTGLRLAEDIARYDQALGFLKKLEEYGEYDVDTKARLEYKKLCSDKTVTADQLYRYLHEFTKKFNKCAEALSHLARIEVEAGRSDPASQLLIRAAKASGDIKYWREASEVWVKANQPQKALAVGKLAKADLKGDGKLQVHLMITRLQLQMALLTDAYRSIEEFADLATNQTIPPSEFIVAEYLTLKAWYYNLIGNVQASADTLKVMDNLFQGIKPNLGELFGSKATIYDEPSPQYSTP